MIARITTRSQDEKVSEEGNELTRLCDMIQRIFFKIRESTFERNISKVETEDDKRYFYDEPRESHVVVSALPEGLSDEDRAAVLSYMRCAFSVSLMWNIQNVLLKGIADKIEEVHGKVTHCPMQTVCQDDRKRMLSYSFLPAGHVPSWFTTTEGDKYALDLTGAQFGHHTTLTQWSEYEADLGFEFSEVRPTNTSLGTMLLGHAGILSEKIAEKIEQELKLYIKRHSDDWQRSLHGELDQIIDSAIERVFEEDSNIIHYDGKAVLKDHSASEEGQLAVNTASDMNA